MSRCYFCKGPLEEKAVRVFRERGRQIQVIDGVTAEVCTRCGLETYPAWVAEEMDRILADNLPEENILVPRFCFKKTKESAEQTAALTASR